MSDPAPERPAGAPGRALRGMSWLRSLAGAYLVFAMAVTLMRHSPTLSAHLPDLLLNSIAPTDNSYIDQTYRYGSTMGGNFQQHQ